MIRYNIGQTIVTAEELAPDDIQKAFAEELRIIGIEIAEWDEK